MFKNLKLTTSLLVVFSAGIILASADTKILHTIGIPVEDSYRHEIVSLDNDHHLLVEGSFKQDFEIPHDDKNRLTLMAIYVTDKNGHKVKYTLKKKEFQRPYHLNPSTLKAAAG